MASLLRELDLLLRGRFTSPAALSAGRVELPVRRLVLAALLLGAAYGACMGLFGALRGGGDGWRQLSATVAKVPLLFLITLAVTFPSLYVSSALADTRLEVRATLRLLLAAIATMLAVLASLGPVVAFFTLSTTSYPFMVLLNVVVFAAAGFAGLAVLLRALRVLFAALEPEPAPEAPPGEGGAQPVAGAAADAVPLRSEGTGAAPAAAPVRKRAARRPEPRALFATWMVLLAVVGAQLGWILRPFIGAPGLPFELLRDRRSNFFAACAEAFVQLFQ